MKNWMNTLRTLIWKDLLQEWRSKDMLTAMLAFAILSIFIFNYAMELDPRQRAELAPGILWVVITFSGTLGLNRSFVAEQEQGSFDALVMAVPGLGSIWLAKQISNFLMMMILILIVLPVYSLLYNQNLFIPGLLMTLTLGAWSFSAAGTLHGSGASGGGSGGRAPEGLQGAGLAQDLFERADAALYLAKQQGRNRVALQPAAAADTSVWH